MLKKKKKIGATSLVVQVAQEVKKKKKNLLAVWETRVRSLDPEDPLERKWLPTSAFLPGESHGRGAWWATVHGGKETDMTE